MEKVLVFDHHYSKVMLATMSYNVGVFVAGLMRSFHD